ncbi:MAG: HEAT repeat domain-containing protein [Nanoarchaeota archaeon]|nr:HEAT repeat domain-containing protein [Nanoarchaeota archaeon]
MDREDNYGEIVLNLKKSMEERIQAAFQLENAVKEENILKLVKGLFTDPSPIVRHEFAFSLGETGRSDLVGKYLMKSVEEDENLFVRHESILALATLGDPRVIPFVERFLKDPDKEMSESAEIALQRLRI